MRVRRTQRRASSRVSWRLRFFLALTSILNAAVEALAGDPDASMAEIARRAGVVRATIYMHFPTRDSLLDAVMEGAESTSRELKQQWSRLR